MTDNYLKIDQSDRRAHFSSRTPIGTNAAEHGDPFVFISRITFAKAMFGEDKPPIGNPEGKKGHRWGRRKLARDR